MMKKSWGIILTVVISMTSYISSTAQDLTYLKSGISLYGGLGASKWWSNAQPGKNMSYNLVVGADKKLLNWFEIGGSLEFGNLYGERMIGTNLDFSSSTSYTRFTALGTVDLINMIWGKNQPAFHLKLYTGVSYLSGSITVEKGNVSEKFSYYDLDRNTGSYGSLVIPGGAMIEVDVNDKFSIFTSVMGVVEPTDVLDGVGYLDTRQLSDGSWEFYNFDTNEWLVSETKPTDDELFLDWYDNFMLIQVGIRYRLTDFKTGGKEKKQKANKRGGSKDNFGNYKRLPDKVTNFNGADGLNKTNRPKY